MAKAVQRGLVLLGAIGLVAAGLAAQGGQPTFRTGVDMVHFGVTVVDKKGRLPHRPGRAGFRGGTKTGRSRRFGSSCRATRRQADASRPSRLALHLGVLFDISGSMEADMAFSRSAAIKFLNTLNGPRGYTLVDFDTEVRVTRYSQSEFAALVERIRSRKPDG